MGGVKGASAEPGGFTSGLDPMRVAPNHDPEPLVEVASGRRVAIGREPARGFWIVSPRPEFDVLDNPILAAFRADEYRRPTKKRRGLDVSQRGLRAQVLADRLGRGIVPSKAMKSTPEQIDHARRVLTKLAAVRQEHADAR